MSVGSAFGDAGLQGVEIIECSHGASLIQNVNVGMTGMSLEPVAIPGHSLEKR
jgi:hypothetical protein